MFSSSIDRYLFVSPMFSSSSSSLILHAPTVFPVLRTSWPSFFLHACFCFYLLFLSFLSSAPYSFLLSFPGSQEEEEEEASSLPLLLLLHMAKAVYSRDAELQRVDRQLCQEVPFNFSHPLSASSPRAVEEPSRVLQGEEGEAFLSILLRMAWERVWGEQEGEAEV